MGHSVRCSNLLTRWDKNLGKCVPCNKPVKRGYEISPNCGFDDDGGQHEPPQRKCKNNTFNDGSKNICQPCSLCSPGYTVITNCSTTSDTQCAETTTRPPPPLDKDPTPSQHVSTPLSQTFTTQIKQEHKSTVANIKPTNPQPGPGPNLLWAVPIIVTCMLLVLSVFIIYRKKKRGQAATLSYRKRSSLINEGFSPLSPAATNNDLEEVLSYEIMSAPLQTVLNNLDVLEELVILLDPDSNTVKSTKHLASLCYFSSTWITYAYSMKDTKSPLKAVLEGVASKYPDWTVGDLAKMLKKIERNDAIAVLAQLKLQVITI